MENVSRETEADLKTFCSLVLKWNPKVNLVSRASVSDIWNRHVEDSLQITEIDTDPSAWVDLGAGGGFPGIIAAIVLRDRYPAAKVTLVESDQRKSAFLRAAAREIGLSVSVVTQRIEECQNLGATTLSARALAPLSQLLQYAERHMQPDGKAIFPKGSHWQKEVSDACREWSFSSEEIKSRTDPDAAILVIRDIKKLK